MTEGGIAFGQCAGPTSHYSKDTELLVPRLHRVLRARSEGSTAQHSKE